MATKYRVNWKLDFGATKYHEGAELRERDIPAGQIETLMKCGVITAVSCEPTPEEKQAEAVDKLGKLAAAEIGKLTKDKLAELAQQRFGTVLDPADMTKDAMLAAIAELAAQKASE